MANVPDGHGFVAGRKRATAARLLELAAELELDPRVVSATSDGYIVPLNVLDAYEGAAEAAPEAEASAVPTSDWKNADIEAYAADNGIDLDGATKKADMLAAITAAENKEE